MNAETTPDAKTNDQPISSNEISNIKEQPGKQEEKPAGFEDFDLDDIEVIESKVFA